MAVLVAFLVATVAGAATEPQRVVAPDGQPGDRFGSSVALSGKVLVAGTPWGGATEDGSEGVAYVFRWQSSQWVFQQKLAADDGANGDLFGWSVGVSGDVVIVGAKQAAILDVPLQGAAYVFRWNGSSWEQEQKLSSSAGPETHFFGESVSVSGDVAVVGEVDVGLTVPDEPIGAAYVYRWNGEEWLEEDVLTPSDGVSGDDFASSVSISGSRIVASSPQATVEEDRGAGAAYVYAWDGRDWPEQQKLTAWNRGAEDFFGTSVSISGDRVIAGSPTADVGSEISQGLAFTFRWSGSRWEDEQQLAGWDTDRFDNFGRAVSLAGNAAVVGAPRTDLSVGAAYTFHWDGSGWVDGQKISDPGLDANDRLGASVAATNAFQVAGSPEAKVDWRENQGIVSSLPEPAAGASAAAALLTLAALARGRRFAGE